MMRRLLYILPLASFMGCAESEFATRDDANSEDIAIDAFEVDETELSAFRLDLTPFAVAEAEVGATLVPQSFGPFLGPGRYDLILATPVPIDGEVSAQLITPWPTATLPFEEPVGLQAAVSIRQLDSVQSYNTSTLEGLYDLAVLPDDGYEFTVIPENPEIPLHYSTLTVSGEQTIDLLLADGAPLYGEVMDERDTPLEDVAVYAQNAAGVRSSPSMTDSEGRYLIRVPAGEWQVVSEGRDSGRDPVIYGPWEEIDSVGAETNFVYPDLALLGVTGQVIGEGGDKVDDVTVRFTSMTLTNYGLVGVPA